MLVIDQPGILILPTRESNCMVLVIIEKYMLRRICTSHFREWQIYLKTLLDWGLRVQILCHHQHIRLQSVSWLLTAPFW